MKVDGATKENYVWGFRLGFLTLAARGLTAAHFTALEQKLMGAVRSSVSSSGMLTQSLLLRGMRTGTYHADRDRQPGGDRGTLPAGAGDSRRMLGSR